MIDNQWENVDTLEDIYKIIQNKLGNEIVYKLNEIIEIMVDNVKDIQIDELERQIYETESKNEDLQDEIHELERKIKKLNIKNWKIK